MTSEPSGEIAWYHKPAWIAVLALLVLGPLALPLVWRSPAFGTTGRWIATVLILSLTVVIVWQTFVTTERLLMELQLQPP